MAGLCCAEHSDSRLVGASKTGVGNPGSRTGSRTGSRSSQRAADVPTTDTDTPAPADQQQASDLQAVTGAGEETSVRSWTLHHVTEIVLLATEVKLAQQIGEALDSMQGGKNDALEVKQSAL